MTKSVIGGDQQGKSSHGIIESGRNKNNGGHDHRTNKGQDRTPSQKVGDKAITKSTD